MKLHSNASPQEPDCLIQTAHIAAYLEQRTNTWIENTKSAAKPLEISRESAAKRPEISREAAKECSPRRQPWGRAENPDRAPEGRKKRTSRYMSVLRVEDRGMTFRRTQFFFRPSPGLLN